MSDSFRCYYLLPLHHGSCVSLCRLFDLLCCLCLLTLLPFVRVMSDSFPCCYLCLALHHDLSVSLCRLFACCYVVSADLLCCLYLLTLLLFVALLTCVSRKLFDCVACY